MKKIFALPLAALLIVACSEPTTSSNSDLALRYAKPSSGGFTDICGTSPLPACVVNDFYDFQGGITAAGTNNTTLGTETLGTLNVDALTIQQADSAGTLDEEKFIGRFPNIATALLINVPAGNANYSLVFDLYTIGSWDGKGKQAQQGSFNSNNFSIAYTCPGSPTTHGTIFISTFSNQLTVQQDFPNALGLGGFKAATGSYGKDLLGYRYDPSSNTPLFRSFGDVEYTLQYTGTNPCGTGALTFVLSSTGSPSGQGVYDESWGIDNIHIKAN
jgi:hypothetical protein